VFCGSLKDDTERMNDRNKHKMTGQMNHQTADTKANASVFLFFPHRTFFKTQIQQINGKRPFKPYKSKRKADTNNQLRNFENTRNACECCQGLGKRLIYLEQS
jgi:hypothetical protein